MYINQYKYIVGDEVDGNTLKISSIDRSAYMNAEYLKLVGNDLRQLNLVGTTALLYAGGASIHHSDARVLDEGMLKGNVVIKSQSAYNAYMVARVLGNIDFVSINSNTCASTMYALYEASKLVNEYDNVIIYAEEVIDLVALKLFKQLGIDMTCTDAVAWMHLTGTKTSNSVANIEQCSWAWNRDSSPMSVSAEGYRKAISKLVGSPVDIVKTHGTETDRNKEEEIVAVDELIDYGKVVRYKDKIGHTQGASALVELGMLLDTEQFDTAICLASGLGGFYGGIRLTTRI